MCRRRLLYNIPYFLAVCFFQALYGFLSVTIALVLNYFIDIISTSNTVEDVLKIGIVTILYATIYAGTRAIADSLAYSYCNNASRHLRSDIFRANLSMRYDSFTKKDSGQYLNQVTNDVKMINDNYYIQIFSMVSFATQFFFCVIYSFYMNVIIAVMMFALTVLQTLVPIIFGKSIKSATNQVSEKNAAFTSKVKELLLGFEVIKSYRCESTVQAEYENVNESLSKRQKKSDVLKQIMMCSNLMLAWTIIFSSVITAGILVIQGVMTIANLFAVFYLSNHYTMPVMHFFSAYTMVKSSRGIREKLDLFFDENNRMDESDYTGIKECVNISNLSFGYTTDVQTIQRFDFTFKRGGKYLLIGESGCGKSTLLKILSGLYRTNRVYYDNDPSTADARKKILLVSQQPFLFHKSIRDNIDLLSDNDAAKLNKIIEDCQINEFIDSLPNGADTVVDEEVNRLSGGQKARIGLARALYNAPDVLLIDEVTSSLDNETAQKIEEMILSLPNTLVIHVSHKPFETLSTRYDNIIEMCDGEIYRVS